MTTSAPITRYLVDPVAGRFADAGVTRRYGTNCAAAISVAGALFVARSMQPEIFFGALAYLFSAAIYRLVDQIGGDDAPLPVSWQIARTATDGLFLASTGVAAYTIAGGPALWGVGILVAAFGYYTAAQAYHAARHGSLPRFGSATDADVPARVVRTIEQFVDRPTVAMVVAIAALFGAIAPLFVAIATGGSIWAVIRCGALTGSSAKAKKAPNGRPLLDRRRCVRISRVPLATWFRRRGPSRGRSLCSLGASRRPADSLPRPAPVCMYYCAEKLPGDASRSCSSSPTLTIRFFRSRDSAAIPIESSGLATASVSIAQATWSYSIAYSTSSPVP